MNFCLAAIKISVLSKINIHFQIVMSVKRNVKNTWRIGFNKYLIQVLKKEYLLVPAPVELVPDAPVLTIVHGTYNNFN